MIKKLTLILSVGLLLTACGSKNVTPENATIEDLVVADADFLITVDASDDDQRENLKSLVMRLPQGKSLWNSLSEGLENELALAARDDQALVESFQSIISDDWKIGVVVGLEGLEEDLGKDLDSNLEESFENLADELDEKLLNGETTFYVLFETESPDLVEELFEADEMAPEMQTYADMDFKTWNPEQDLFIIRVGNVFGFAPQENTLELIAKLAAGELEGFSQTEGIELLEEYEGMVKAYISEEAMTIVDLVYAQAGVQLPIADLMDSPLIYGLSFENEGLRVFTNYEVNVEVFEEIYGYDKTDSLKLVNSVNGDGVIAYFETLGLGTAVNLMLEQAEGLAEADPDFAVIEPALLKAKEFLVNDLEIEYEDLIETLDGNLAFAFGYEEGGFMPHLTMYLDLESEVAKATMGKLTIKFDELVEAAIDNANVGMMFELPGLEADFFELVEEGDFKVVRVSEAGRNFVLELFRAQTETDPYVAGMLAGVDLEKQFDAAVVNYGVVDDVFMISIGNGKIAENFGKNVLADNEDYQALLQKLVLDEGQMVFYASGQEFSNYLDFYAEVFANEISFGLAVATAQEYLNAFSVISVTGIEDSMMLGDFFLSVK